MAAPQQKPTANAAAQPQPVLSTVDIQGLRSFRITYYRHGATEACMIVIPGVFVGKLHIVNIRINCIRKLEIFKADRADADNIIRQHLEAHGVLRTWLRAEDEAEIQIYRILRALEVAADKSDKSDK